MVRLHQPQHPDGAPAELSKKILCIEDDREVARLITEALTDWGYDAIVAHDSHEGFIAILKGLPDLVLCDIGLANISGFDLLERLNKILPRLRHVPFVFVTALSGRNNELQARRLGADDYITKPIDFEMLEATIHSRLARISANDLWLKFAMLSDREAETMAWSAQGKTSSQIAKMLGLTKPDIEQHLDMARIKLDAATRPAAKLGNTNSRPIEH